MSSGFKESEIERQLLADVLTAICAPQPWRALVLLRQSEARRDPSIGAEQLADKIRAVALLAAVKQHNVVRQSAGAVEEFAYSLAAARPAMATTLDSFRSLLEDLGSGLGVTDPVSGPVVLELK